MAKFIESSKDLDPKDFESIEALIGQKIPVDLKKFYLKNNGGYPVDNAFYLNSDEYICVLFHPIKYRVSEHRLTVESAWKLKFGFEKIFDKNCIPIGIEDVSGDGVYYSLDNDDFGKIFLYQHDTTTDNIDYLGKSLDEFVSNLEAMPEEDYS